MSAGYALIEIEDGVAVVTINRPERLNAWGPDVSSQVIAALREVEASAEVSGVVLTGAGRAFCAGADLKEQRIHSIGDVETYLDERRGVPIFDALSDYSSR